MFIQNKQVSGAQPGRQPCLQGEALYGNHEGLCVFIFGHSDLSLYVSFPGHLIGPVLCHSFCNYMGFPAISTALEHPQRLTILSSYLMGVLLFFMLLFPLTNPSYYGFPTPVCTLTSSPSSLCFSWPPPPFSTYTGLSAFVLLLYNI